MNLETLSLIQRPFQDIVDDILVAMVGGVVNEPIFFDVKEDLYPLAEPAQDVRGITGKLNGERHAFQKGIDFDFSSGDNGIIWLEDGTRPNDETIFHVDYFRQNSRSPLTDINVGSVTRTISEAIGREIATVYEQINLAYFSGFIDTAEGKALDLVVSILGITRKTKDFAQGLVTFFRDTEIKGNITIPQGTSLSTTDGEKFFQTVEVRTLQQGQVRIDIPVLAGEDFRAEAGKADAGAITELATPIAGIARVTNFEPTILSADDETDEQLRARARAALRSLGKATLLALIRVIAEGRASLLEIRDPNSPPDKRTETGNVLMLVEAEPERFPSLRAAVEETRAAGILATMIARYVFFKPRITAGVAPGLTAPGKEKVIEEVIAALQVYVDGLSSGDVAEGSKMLDAIKEVEDVKESQIVDVLAFRTDIGQPGAESLVDSLVDAITGVPPDDREALRAALQTVLSEAPSAVDTGRRVPDRSLVQGLSGEPATDEEIEEGTFEISATVAGEAWWVVLDMEPADVLLTEGGD